MGEGQWLFCLHAVRVNETSHSGSGQNIDG